MLVFKLIHLRTSHQKRKIHRLRRPSEVESHWGLIGVSLNPFQQTQRRISARSALLPSGECVPSFAKATAAGQVSSSYHELLFVLGSAPYSQVPAKLTPRRRTHCLEEHIQFSFNSVPFILYSPISQITNLPQRALQSVHIRHP